MSYTAALFVRFRGQRSYIRSADVYPLIVTHAGIAGNKVTSDLRIDFARVVTRCLEVSIFPKDSKQIDRNAAFSFSYNSDGRAMMGFLVETEALVTQRYDSDDEAIYRRIELSGDELSVVDPNGNFEPIDMIAALAAMHEHFEPASSGRKWLIARLEFSELPPARTTQRLCARINRRLGKSSIRSSLLLDGREIGRLLMVQGVVGV